MVFIKNTKAKLIMNLNINYSIDCLKIITEEFDKNNIPYWLDYGTLLGAYRDFTLISHD